MRTVRVFGTACSMRGLLTMVSGTLIMISISATYSFPNLNTYMISYMRNRTDETLTYADFVFISQGRSLIGGLTAPLGGIIAGHIGFKPTLLIASILHSSGYALVYFALDMGIWACAISIAFGAGFGLALMYYNTVVTVMKVLIM
jgi:hypothetical protein